MLHDAIGERIRVVPVGVFAVMPFAEMHAHRQFRQGPVGPEGFKHKMGQVPLDLVLIFDSPIWILAHVPRCVLGIECIHQP